MILFRHCSKIGCSKPAIATLTYSHADQTAVLGPLSLVAEPHTYDLCSLHTQRMTPPRGWQIVRLELPAPDVDPDALEAVVEAVNSEVEKQEREEDPVRPAPVQRSWRTPLTPPPSSQQADTSSNVRPLRPRYPGQ